MGNTNPLPKSQSKVPVADAPDVTAQQVKLAEEVANHILPLTEGRLKAPSKIALETLFGGNGKIIGVGTKGKVSGQPFAVQFYYTMEAWAAKEWAHDNFGFLKDYAKLKHDYDKYKLKKTADGMASLKKEMNEIYELYMIEHTANHGTSPWLINVPSQVFIDMRKKAPPFKENAKKQLVATTADERFVREGEVVEPRGYPWTEYETHATKLLNDGVLAGLRGSKLYSQWEKAYGDMYDKWRNAEPEAYNKYLKDFDKTDKATVFNTFLKRFVDQPQIKRNIESQEEDKELHLQKIRRQNSAAHHQYGNILMDDFGTSLHYKPYDYKHNGDVAHVHGGYPGDLSHVSVAHNYGPPPINNESEVMFSVLVMMMIFIGGMVLCFFCWIWCAFAGYFFVSMKKDGKGKKKQYAPVEREDNDIERAYDSN